MFEKIHETSLGRIHYWINDIATQSDIALVFLHGLTVDHRLFDKQIDYFKHKYKVIVWDAPAHASSYPFDLNFDLFDVAKWLDEILIKEGVEDPILIGQSMGGYIGQVYAELFPEKLRGVVMIDSPPLQRRYYTAIELWLLKRMEVIYKVYPWNALVKAGTKGVSTTEYGRKIMSDMMRVYEGNQARYAQLAGHGYKALAEAVEKNLDYEIQSPHMWICGKEDRAGSCIRYLKAYEKNTGQSIKWIEHAGHNANTDQPQMINELIDEFVRRTVV